MGIPRDIQTDMKEPLTKIQKRTLDYISSFISENGIAPSFEDLKKKFGLSTNSSVFERLWNLEAKGWIKRKKFKARYIIIKRSHS